MPTTQDDTIGATARAYSTITLWEAGTDNDLVAADEIRVGQMYDDADFSESVAMAGDVTDSTRFRRLTPAAGQEYSPTADTGVNWISTSGYNCDMSGSDNFKLRGPMQLTADSSGGLLIRSSSSAGTFSSLFILCDTTTTAAPCVNENNGGSDDHLVINVICYGSGNDTAGARFGLLIQGGSSFYNCVAYNITRGAARGIQNSGGGGADADIRNCISMECDTDFLYHGTPVGTISHNCSSDDTADDQGSNSIINQTLASIFTDAANSDFTLASGSNAIDAGVDLSGTFSNDFNQDTRTGTWDMGAYDFSAGVVQIVTKTVEVSDSIHLVRGRMLQVDEVVQVSDGSVLPLTDTTLPLIVNELMQIEPVDANPPTLPLQFRRILPRRNRKRIFNETIEVSEALQTPRGRLLEISETVQIGEQLVFPRALALLLDEIVQIGDQALVQATAAGSTVLVLDETVEISETLINPVGLVIALVVATETVELVDDFRRLKRGTLTLVVDTETVNVGDALVFMPIDAEAFNELVQIGEGIVLVESRLSGKRYQARIFYGGAEMGFVDAGGVLRGRVARGR